MPLTTPLQLFANQPVYLNWAVSYNAAIMGTWVDAGEAFAQVSPLDTMRVEIGVSETDVARVRPGQPLRLKVLGFPDRQFKGRVTEVGWEGESAAPGKPAVFKVVGWVANPGPNLRSGMTGVEVGPELPWWTGRAAA